VDFLPLFAKIDEVLDKGRAVIAVEGGSASGKTTLSDMLREVYGCNVLHMDDFFLRPEQRTPERFAQIGGNIDRERFFEEVVLSLASGDTVRYRPFDCHTQTLGEEITVAPGGLTVVEGVYSTHPSFGRYFDISVFLDISAGRQKQRILKRNSPQFANRFFNEWIPCENNYFSKTNVKEKCGLCIEIK
jgi:uridine kinase